MIDLEIWRAEPAGVLAAESCDFRLIVQAPEVLGCAVRFLVLRRGGRDGRDCLLGSGTMADVRSAMEAAERMAERCAGLGLLESALPE